MITYACISIQGQYNQPCSKAMEATLKQTGVSQNLGALESYGRSRAQYMAVKYVGQPTIETIGSIYYLYHIYQTQTLSLKLPNFGIANSIDTTLTPNSAQLGLKWSIR
jgi:hypothetical protein